MRVLLATWQLVVLDVPGDGFCILRAVIKSLSYIGREKFNLTSLKALLREFIVNNQAKYNAYGENNVSELTQFLDTGTFFQVAVDLIPEILVNTLEINLTIITELPNDSCSITRLHPETAVQGERLLTVTLVRHDAYSEKNLGTHYSSAVPAANLPSKLVKKDISPGDWILSCPKSGETYHIFRSPSWLSNFHQSRFVVDSQSYSCNEQYIQANRYPKGSHMYSTIMSEKSPIKMKALGDKATKNQSRDIVNAVTAIWHKFMSNPKLKVALAGTGNQILVEGTHSKIWAIGRDITKDQESQILRYSSWCGYLGIGVLGVLLMIVRADLAAGKSEPSWDLIDSYFGPLETAYPPTSNSSPPAYKSSHGEGETRQTLDSTRSTSLPHYAPPTGQHTHRETLKNQPKHPQGMESTVGTPSTSACSHLDTNSPPMEDAIHPIQTSTLPTTSPHSNPSVKITYREALKTPPKLPKGRESTVSPSGGCPPNPKNHLVFTKQKNAEYFPPDGWSASRAVEFLNWERPDIARYISPRGNKIICRNPEVQERLKFGIVRNHPCFAIPMTRKTPTSTFLTKWTTKPVPDLPYIREALAAHPRVLYIRPANRFGDKVSWHITTAYTQADPVPILLERNSLELKGGLVIELVVLGKLHCKKCGGQGHLARACGHAHNHPQNLGDTSQQSLPPSITPLMDISFPNHALPRLTMIYQKCNVALNTQPDSQVRYTYSQLQNVTDQSPKLYIIELPLEKLIHFWSIFPEWIPSLSTCPLLHSENFLVFQNSNNNI